MIVTDTKFTSRVMGVALLLAFALFACGVAEGDSFEGVRSCSAAKTTTTTCRPTVPCN